MKILFDEIKGSIYYTEIPQESEKRNCISGIRYYGCNPTSLSLFLVKSYEQMVQSFNGIVIPVIYDYWDDVWGDLGTTRIKSINWNKSKSILTIFVYDELWESMGYLESLSKIMGCSKFIKVTLNKRSQVLFFNNTMNKDTAALFNYEFDLMNANNCEKLIYKYLREFYG